MNSATQTDDFADIATPHPPAQGTTPVDDFADIAKPPAAIQAGGKLPDQAPTPKTGIIDKVKAEAQKPGTEIVSDLTPAPIRGAGKEAMREVAGLLDLGRKLDEYVTPAATRDAGGGKVLDAEKKASDWLKEGTDVNGLWEGIGALGEQVGEIALPETWLGKLGEGVRVAKGAEEAIHAVSDADKIAEFSSYLKKTIGGTEEELAPHIQAFKEYLKTAAAKAPQVAESGPKEISSFLDKYPKIKALVGLGVKSVAEGTKAAAEQGAQTYVHTGSADEAKRAAEVGGVAGGAVGVAAEIPVGKFFKNVLRNRFNIDEVQTEKVIGETKKANAKISEDADKIHADNVEAIKQARDAGNEADATRLEHEDVVSGQQAVEAKRTNLTDAMAKTQNAISRRVQAINDSAKSYFKKGFDDVRAKLDAPDPETGRPHTISYADLDEDVEKVEHEIKGSRENVKQFQDIAKKAQGSGESNLSREDLEMMSPSERREAMDLPSAKYSDLDGYYQEVGRTIGNPATASDVRQALVKFRELLGKRMQDLADEVDPALGKQHALLRRQYKEYAGGFKDYSGPSDSGSPVAKSLQAKDSYNATKPYMDLKQPAEKLRGKKILTGDTTKPETQFTEKTIVGPDGKETPAWKFRKDTHALVDHMRNLQEGLDSLPKPKKLAEETAASAENLAKSRTAARDAANPKLTPEPATTPATPDLLKAEKEAKLHDAAHNLSKFGTWLAVMGPVGAIATFLKTGDIKKSGEVLAGGIAGGLITPYVLTKLLDNPKVVESLTKVSRKDLQLLSALPPSERAGVEDGMKKLADEAVASGKLKAERIPWLRIIASKGAVSATSPSSQQPTSDSNEDIEKDLQQMQQGVQ